MTPFLSDRPRIGGPARPAPAASPFAPPGAPAAPAHAAHGGGARVECVREGDRITRLVVVCACGERTEIDCLYAAGR